MELTQSQPDRTGADFAGSTPAFPGLPGATLQTGLRLPNFQSKRLIFNRIGQPGQVHVYAAECGAGERLRVQMLVPMLPAGGAAVPAFAVVAQSLPYSADMQKLPFTTPAGFSAVVATPPAQLTAPAKDVLTRVRYYLGPAIDTRTLIGGRAYIVVWSPHNHMGKYVLQVGQRWPLQWSYWAQLPIYWWRIRGWFGQSRAALIGAVAGVALLSALLIGLLRRTPRDREGANT
jgi:hypothetical protein